MPDAFLSSFKKTNGAKEFSHKSKDAPKFGQMRRLISRRFKSDPLRSLSETDLMQHFTFVYTQAFPSKANVTIELTSQTHPDTM